MTVRQPHCSHGPYSHEGEQLRQCGSQSQNRFPVTTIRRVRLPSETDWSTCRCAQRSEEHQFLYETTVTASVADVTRELAQIHNLRLRIHRLKYEGDELAQFGPIKLPEKQVWG